MHEELFATVPFFKSFDAEELRLLASMAKPVEKRAGEVIFYQGDSRDALYIVLSGEVELFVKSSAGEKLILKLAGAGQYFGELAVLGEGARTASAAAVVDVELLSLSQDDFISFFRSKPEAIMELLQVLDGMIRQTNILLQSHVSKNPNLEIEQDLNWAQKIAQGIAYFSGSIQFLLLNVFFFVVWMFWNSGLVPGMKQFDPFPYGLLTMIVSLEAIILSIFVLLAQNLQNAKDHIRGDIEYEVNIKAELEIAQLHEKVDHIHTEILQQLNRVERQIRQKT